MSSSEVRQCHAYELVHEHPALTAFCLAGLKTKLLVLCHDQPRHNVDDWVWIHEAEVKGRQRSNKRIHVVSLKLNISLNWTKPIKGLRVVLSPSAPDALFVEDK